MWRWNREPSQKNVPHYEAEDPVMIMSVDQNDYISLTDMARARTDARAADVIKNGLPPALLWNFWAYGKSCIIRILKWSNSTALRVKNAVGMYVQAVHMRIKILYLNSDPRAPSSRTLKKTTLGFLARHSARFLAWSQSRTRCPHMLGCQVSAKPKSFRQESHLV